MGNELEELLDAGDQVVALLTFRGEGRSSGAAVEARIANVWTLHEGKVVRMQYFGDREEALAAALSGREAADANLGEGKILG
jgi:ketosteroid isomerase-like protein